MNTYLLTFDAEHHRLLVPEREEDLDGSNLWIDGSRKLSSWRTPEMRYSERQGQETVADIAQITPGFFAYSEKAVEALGSLLRDSGELLPFAVEGASLFAFNPQNEINCFDEAASEWRIRRDGSKGRLVKVALDTSKVAPSVGVFQVPELIQTHVFATEKFRETYFKNGLTGLIFEPGHYADTHLKGGAG